MREDLVLLHGPVQPSSLHSKKYPVSPARHAAPHKRKAAAVGLRVATPDAPAVDEKQRFFVDLQPIHKTTEEKRIIEEKRATESAFLNLMQLLEDFHAARKLKRSVPPPPLPPPIPPLSSKRRLTQPARITASLRDTTTTTTTTINEDLLSPITAYHQALLPNSSALLRRAVFIPSSLMGRPESLVSISSKSTSSTDCGYPGCTIATDHQHKLSETLKKSQKTLNSSAITGSGGGGGVMEEEREGGGGGGHPFFENLGNGKGTGKKTSSSELIGVRVRDVLKDAFIAGSMMQLQESVNFFGQRRYTWKERYFVLYREHLCKFRKDASGTLVSGIMKLTPISTVFVTNEFPGKSYCVEIKGASAVIETSAYKTQQEKNSLLSTVELTTVNKNRLSWQQSRWRLQAPNSTCLKAWMENIKRAITLSKYQLAKLPDDPTPPSPTSTAAAAIKRGEDDQFSKKFEDMPELRKGLLQTSLAVVDEAAAGGGGPIMIAGMIGKR